MGVLRRLDTDGLEPANLTVRDRAGRRVLSLTGHHAEDAQPPEVAAAGGGQRRRRGSGVTAVTADLEYDRRIPFGKIRDTWAVTQRDLIHFIRIPHSSSSRRSSR